MSGAAGVWGPGVVLMPVPVAFAQEVHDHVQALVEGRARATGMTAGAEVTVVVPGQGPWTRAEVNHLADALAYDGVVALLDACAAAPGTWVPKSQVEAAQGITAVQFRNELGALSKLTRRLFGDVRWPMEWKREKGAYLYRLDEQVASWWTAAKAGA